MSHNKWLRFTAGNVRSIHSQLRLLLLILIMTGSLAAGNFQRNASHQGRGRRYSAENMSGQTLAAVQQHSPECATEKLF